MKLLALDTSSVACSVALATGTAVFERHEEQAREHTRILLPMIRAVLADAGLAPADLDGIVLGNGPGSFIGMRIGASVAQGLAFAAGLQIAPVSSLLAVAAEAFATTAALEAVVAQDAHMQEVYLGIYRRGEHPEMPDCAVERLCAVAAIPEIAVGTDGLRLAAGCGWQRYPELLACNAGRIELAEGLAYPRARYLLESGAAMLHSGRAVDPRLLEPAYLRDRVAEIPGQGT